VRVRSTAQRARHVLGSRRSDYGVQMRARIEGALSSAMLNAVRLEAALGGSARFWVNMQVVYDLWHAKRRVKILAVKRIRKISKAVA
jgi:plasmid maintenance system antidote protein VapI